MYARVNGSPWRRRRRVGPYLFLLDTGTNVNHGLLPDVQSVLGQWFLSGFDYTFDLRGKNLEFGKQDRNGTRARFTMPNGRTAISTSLGDLVLHSGATRLVQNASTMGSHRHGCPQKQTFQLPGAFVRQRMAGSLFSRGPEPSRLVPRLSGFRETRFNRADIANIMLWAISSLPGIGARLDPTSQSTAFPSRKRRLLFWTRTPA